MEWRNTKTTVVVEKEEDSAYAILSLPDLSTEISINIFPTTNGNNFMSEISISPEDEIDLVVMGDSLSETKVRSLREVYNLFKKAVDSISSALDATTEEQK